MREFFRGWRRKVGCLTLLMACSLMAVSIRSKVVVDEVAFRKQSQYDIYCDSSDGYIGWVFINDPRRPSNTSLSTKLRSLSWITNPAPIDVFGGVEWQFRRSGFGWGKYPPETATTVSWKVITLPYWSLALPLALISAYLILWKARKPAVIQHA